MKILFLIINLLIGFVVHNEPISERNVSVETSEAEEQVYYSPEDSLLWNITNDDELEEVHSRSEELTLTFQVSKTNLDIDRFSVNTTTYCGTVNYTMSGALFFLDSSSTTFNLTIINVGLENSQIIIDLNPQTNINGVITPIDKTTINIYFMGELAFYSISTLSLTNAREKAYDYLYSQGLESGETIDRDEYIYQEPQNHNIIVSPVDDNTKNIIDGTFSFQSEDLNYYPADGIKIGLYAYDENNNVVYFDETYIDELGYFSLELRTTTYNNLSLIIYAETEYTKFYSKTTFSIVDEYKYQIDLTNIVLKSFGKKYTINNLYVNHQNDRGQAFGNAVLMNAGGRFYENILEGNINQVNVVQPGSGFYSAGENYISLPDYGQEGALHEYGHYVHKVLNLARPFGGFGHDNNEDLALRYPDFQNSDNYEKGRGYYAAWNEGFATFYSNLVQNYYDYSYLSSTWKDEYIDFQQLDTSGYVQFKLRESNEKTVTNVLLALCDPQFKYDDAIGVKDFFDLLKENNDVASLSDALNVIKENIDDSIDVITKVTSYYKIAPNNLLATIKEIDDNGNTTIVEKDKNSIFTEFDIPTFKWDVGNHVFYNSYLTYKNNGNGDRYTYQEALQDPSVRKYNYGLSNNDFTIYIYNSNGEELLKKENIQYEISSSKVASYTPTREEWKSVFYSSSFYCYWMVEGKDINHTYIGKIEQADYTSEFDAQTGYTYQSEPFPFNLEKIYKEYETHTTNQNYDIENLELSVELFTKTQTNQLPRKYEIKINYKWDEEDLPDVRLTDFIVVQWNYIYNLNGTLYSVNYYDNDEIYTFDESYEGQILYYGSPYRELYYTADLRYDTNSETVSKLYGEAAIGIETTQNYDSLFVGVTYYHVLNLATVMQGIQQNEYGYYVNTSEIEKVSATYEF